MKNEENYLRKVLDLVNYRIQDNQARIDVLMESLKRGIDDENAMYSVEETYIGMYIKENISLKRHKDSPYFARIDFKEENSNEQKYYLGKVGLVDNNANQYIVDWRAPVANLYYDSALGHTEYCTKKETFKGDLNLKRVYTIKDGKLISYMDVHSTSDDELLKPYLGVNADSKIKNIVSSIQKEQNSIIRDPLHKNMIIQGVAGSGKTTVMLHRISYLAYSERDFYKTNQYIVISPNNLFTDYMSAILPDLEVDQVKQITFEDLAIEFLNLKTKLNVIPRSKTSHYDSISHYKSSKTMVNLLNNYLNKITNDLFNNDLTKNDIVIISKDELHNIFNKFDKEPLKIKIDKTITAIYKYSQDKADIIIKNINNQFDTLVKNETNLEKRKLLIRKSYEVKNTLIKDIKDLIKNYFKDFKYNTLDIYKEFIKTIDYEELVTSTINNLNKKKVDFDDLAALIYINEYLFGNKQYNDFISVSIDEAQDLGYIHYACLRKLFKFTNFSVYGDLSQSIYAYRGIESWDEVKEIIDSDSEIKYLAKSYRTTIEIMNFANKILSYLNVPLAEPVIRHGEEVLISNPKNNLEHIENKINEYLNKGYKSIALICKEEKEVNKYYDLLKNKLKVSKLDEFSLSYDGGICILPISLAKGLEFDAVIVNNVNNTNYDKNNILDMKLLYVALTRALHELNVIYNNELCDVLN